MRDFVSQFDQTVASGRNQNRFRIVFGVVADSEVQPEALSRSLTRDDVFHVIVQSGIQQ